MSVVKVRSLDGVVLPVRKQNCRDLSEGMILGQQSTRDESSESKTALAQSPLRP